MPEEIKDYAYALYKITKWAEENPDFDTTFVDSVRNWMDKGKDLTYAQERAIDRIIKRFRIKL